MAGVKNLRFSYNWNNKLYGQYWTTLRLWNEGKYQHGFVFDIYLKDEYLGVAELKGVRKTKCANLNEFVCGLDTGYNVPQTIKIIERMYKNKPNPDLAFCLFRWVKIEPGCSVDLKSRKDG
jgi:hypothetical protein